MKLSFFKAAAVASLASVVAFSPITQARNWNNQISAINFLIPGGAGGGWDGTARGTGDVLTRSGLVGKASYENMSGGGGGKAIGYLIENAKSNSGTLMVNSTPIVIRSLTKVFPQSFRDLTPIAGTIGDYAALVVKADSNIKSFKDLVAIYNKNPNDLAIAGGSVAGGMDHLVAALAMKSAGADPLSVKYLPFDAGGEAMASLLSGEADALSTGLSEAVGLAEQGEVRILVTTAPAAIDGIPSLKSEGYDAEFVNWRGFFAAPGISADQKAAYVKVLGDMYKTKEWEEVRAQNKWVNIYNPGDDFVKFLEKQESEIGGLMKELGFL
jgi:putative tricarboxylic transport membrane protein